MKFSFFDFNSVSHVKTIRPIVNKLDVRVSLLARVSIYYIFYTIAYMADNTDVYLCTYIKQLSLRKHQHGNEYDIFLVSP